MSKVKREVVKMQLKREFVLNNKKNIKFISIVMALFIMSFSFLGNYVYAADINNIEPPNPGSLDINKVVAPIPGKTNQWEVTLTMTGKNLPVTSDIVLVIDTSGSMKGERLTSAKVAARNFIDTLLTSANTTTRIAVVSFAENVNDPNQSLAFKNFNQKQDLLNKVNSLSADGGTYTQAGLKKARDLLKSSTALNKNIVLLSDGEPTYSCKLNNPDNYVEMYDNSRLFGSDYETKLNIAEAQYNYSQRVGSGNDYRYNYKSTGFLGLGDKYYYNHGNSTINESNFIKNENVIVYSIALSAGDTGNYVLNNVASPGKSYTASINDLNSVFLAVAGNIAYAATNVTVTDPIGEKFSIPGINATNYAQKISVNQGTLAWNNTTETITWTLATISEGNPAVMSYIVQIDSNIQSGQVYSTNGETFATYTNSIGQNARKTFPVPRAGVNAGTIQIHYFRVNETGQPINSTGTQINKEQAEIQSMAYQNGANLQLNVPYNVTGPSRITIVDKEYIYSSAGNTGNANPISVTLTTNLPSKHIWFAYSEVKDVNVTFNENYVGAPSNYIKTTRKGTSLGINMPVAPIRAGYVFNGWKNSIDSSGQNFNQDTTITENVNLFAQWAIFKSELKNNSMYKNIKAEAIGRGNESFKIVKDIDYTFGLEIFLGNRDLSTIIETTGDITLSDFKLFDKDKKEFLDGIGIEKLSDNKYKVTFNISNNLLVVNNIYTITYKIKSNSETTASLKVIRDENKLNLLENAKEVINIETLNMPDLE